MHLAPLLAEGHVMSRLIIVITLLSFLIVVVVVTAVGAVIRILFHN